MYQVIPSVFRYKIFLIIIDAAFSSLAMSGPAALLLLILIY